ncbi:MAG: hypothetical protein KKE64_05655, partial [Candidatus Omnitrophica bacterium]|nr:hypothetical protein [Candidatus Omnitrophota bacterium]
ITALFLYNSSNKNVVNINSLGTNIICFGDSITEGQGSELGKDFPSLLAKMVDMPVINAGIGGDISDGALKRIENDVLRKDPLLVIIEFGGNDFLRKIPLSETVANVEEMIKKIITRGAMVALVDISSGVIMGDYKQSYLVLSAKYKTIFIPNVLSGIITDPLLKSDFIHPNSQGYKVVAHRVFRTIIPYLNINTINRKSKK